MAKTKDFIDIYEETNRWKHDINYKASPLMYEVTNGCGGMYTCEPYKSRLLEVWKYSNIEVAKLSAQSITKIFENYIKDDDFVGADMAKKYLRAGFTRRAIPLECQGLFKKAYKRVEKNLNYLSLRKSFLEKKILERKKYEKR